MSVGVREVNSRCRWVSERLILDVGGCQRG